MSIELWLAFVAAPALLLIIPGPTILTVISYSMAQGRRANVPLVAAVALGDSTALVVSLLGLGARLATSAFWFTIVKWAGGCTCSISVSSFCWRGFLQPSWWRRQRRNRAGSCSQTRTSSPRSTRRGSCLQ